MSYPVRELDYASDTELHENPDRIYHGEHNEPEEIQNRLLITATPTPTILWKWSMLLVGWAQTISGTE